LNLRALFFNSLAATCFSAVYLWSIYPVPFSPPAQLTELRTTEGVIGFLAGRNEPMLTISGQIFVCYFSPSRGPFGSCLLEERNGPMKDVRAYWYLHGQKWPFKGIALLMHVTTTDGRVLMDYESQVKQLTKANLRDPGLSPTALALHTALMFFGTFFATFLFFRRCTK